MKKFKIIKVVGFFLLLSLAVVLIVRCGKDQIFIAPTHTVEIVSGPNGTVSPSGILEWTEGDHFLTIKPDPGYKEVITSNREADIVSLGMNKYQLKIDQDLKVQIEFEKTLSWYLMKGEWKLDSTSIHDLRSGVWSRDKLWGVEGNNQLQLTFFPDGKVSLVLNGTKANDEWSLDETVNPPTLHIGPKGQEHLFGSLFYVIDKLDEEFLILAKYNTPFVEDSTHKADVKEFYSHHD